MYLIEDSESRVVNVFEPVGLSLTIHGHFRVILLHLVLHVEDLLVHIPLVGFTKDQCASQPR